MCWFQACAQIDFLGAALVHAYVFEAGQLGRSIPFSLFPFPFSTLFPKSMPYVDEDRRCKFNV
jgi:hypothetical protein